MESPLCATQRVLVWMAQGKRLPFHTGSPVPGLAGEAGCGLEAAGKDRSPLAWGLSTGRLGTSQLVACGF